MLNCQIAPIVAEALAKKAPIVALESTIITHGMPLLVARPAKVQIKQITGAGDVFMAQHILAELDGAPREAALQSATSEAQNFVAGKI